MKERDIIYETNLHKKELHIQRSLNSEQPPNKRKPTNIHHSIICLLG